MIRTVLRQGQGEPTLRLALLLTGCLALLVVVGAGLIGQLRAGLEVDIGLLVGSANGPLIQRSVLLGARFGVLSLGRLLLLSIIGLGIGLALGSSLAWLVIAGMAVAQILLAAAGAWRLVHE